MTVVVVGGGPAGLAAAIRAARAGARTLLLERNDQCGVKLLATGGGRANVANTLAADEWPARFGRHGRFITPALDRLPLAALLSWLADLGQPAVCRDGFHYFPASNSAKALRDALVAAARDGGVDIRTGCRVERLIAESGALRAVRVAGDGDIACAAAVVACGGKSYPATGSTWDGCRMAEQLGHRVQPAFPGLVGLRVDNLSADLAGLVLPDAEVIMKTRGRAALVGRGELLLTHTGISGPAVLDLSATVAQELAKTPPGGAGRVVLGLRWVAGRAVAEWLDTLEEWRKNAGPARLATLLRDFLPQRLIRWLFASAGVAEDAAPASLRAGDRDRLAAALAHYPAAVVDSEGWERAMVTRGGVDVREVDPGTMASKRVAGLYFAGETLDIDGPCGGFNLHWCFASGALAGDNAARARTNPEGQAL